MREIDLKETQKVLMQMALDVRDVLDRHNIRYFLTFGTLLGAVRHGGFIPWDDDFDIFIFDDEYDHAIKCLQAELPSNLLVHNERNDENYFKSWSSVKDINSSLEFNKQCNKDDLHLKFRSLNVDLYRLKRIKYDEIESYLREEEVLFHLRKYKSKIKTEEETYEKIKESFSKNYNEKKGDISDFEPDEDVFMFVAVMRIPFKMKQLFPLKKIKFEGEVFSAPYNVDQVLKTVYGDYMKLPDESQRVPHYLNVKYAN